ncbi:hypothetical protein JX265_008786 [Neoarthrinium moseri]|uniref:Uncharacterized protein n=1 Tax=Neoarthrinium moseri TaxID=1658444 RepID=A0A9Q0ANB3_9PEZI|nr:hypothetical protein JX265_008786 [Neoarthrinium moseri]
MAGILDLSLELLHMVAEHIRTPMELARLSRSCKGLQAAFSFDHWILHDARHHRTSVLPNHAVGFASEQVPLLIRALRWCVDDQVIKRVVDIYAKEFPASLDGHWGRLRFNVFPLHQACLYQHTGIVEHMLRKGCRVDIRDTGFAATPHFAGLSTYCGDYFDALLFSVAIRNLSMMLTLIKAGHPVSMFHLGHASQMRASHTLGVLLRAYRINPDFDAGDSDFDYALQYTSMDEDSDGNERIINQLLKEAPNIGAESLLSYVDSAVTGNCPRNAVHFFHHLIQRNGPTLQICQKTLSIALRSGCEWLIRAIHPRFTNFLITANADDCETRRVRACAWLLRIALISAKNTATVIQHLPYLLEAGCIPGPDHLCMALDIPDPSPYIDVLVEHGADVNGHSARYGMRPLARAIKDFNGRVVFRLLYHGAELETLGKLKVQASLLRWYWCTFGNPLWVRNKGVADFVKKDEQEPPMIDRRTFDCSRTNLYEQLRNMFDMLLGPIHPLS